MLRRWGRKASRRRARLKFKQQPMTQNISPVREASDQEGCPDSTTVPEHHHPQPADQLSIHGQVTQAVAELEGLSLKIDTFTAGKSEAVEAKSDEDERDTEAEPEPPASPHEDPEEGSQTSGEESWASFPSSGSCSTDCSSSAGEEEGGEEESEPSSGPFMSTAPDAETTFKFREEFSSGESSYFDVDDNDVSGPQWRNPPPPPLVPPPLMEDDEEEDLIYSPPPPPPPPGPWSTSAVPRWAFLESSDSLPTLGLGPEDFYHGGSSLRHEVSAGEDEDVGDGSDEDDESRTSQEVIL